MRKPACFDKHGTNKGAWSKQEDQKLIDYIRTHGVRCWRSLPKSAGLVRCGKSCRLRWINYLRPDVKRGDFAEDEEDLIIKLHALLGNRWSLIAGRLPGRTDNEVKNYWNSHLRRKLVSMGIDPDNHRLSQIQPIHRPQTSETPGTLFSKPAEEQLRKEYSGSLGTPTPTPTTDHNGTESDAASCVEGTCCMLPDLNLASSYRIDR